MIGNPGNVDKAKNVGLVIAAYLKQYKLNLDFAPVADVNTNPKNKVIGNRSFGSDPNRVSSKIVAEIAGLHKEGIVTCVKHFPGHGDTIRDTSTGYVSVEKTWDQLKLVELIPFIDAFATTDNVNGSHHIGLYPL